MLRLKPYAVAFSVLLGGASLTGCGDDDSSAGSDAGASEDGGSGSDASPNDKDASPNEDDGGSEAILNGVAAVGAPIAGGDVLARCADGESYEGTTDDEGEFQIAIPDASYPCALAVSGGDLPATIPALHSLAESAGTTNITPLTELILARALAESTGQSPAEWFAMPKDFDDVIAELTDSSDALRTALSSAGYELPSDWSAGSTAPLRTPFVADPDDDAFDQLLEALGDAVAAGDGDYASLTSDFVSGGTLPQPTGNNSGVTELPATVHASLVGSYALVFAQGGGAGCGSVCSYTDGQTVNVTVNADGTLVVGNTTLDDPFTRKVGKVVYDTEIVWRTGDLEYALSDNKDGAFNEINLGDRSQSSSGFPRFLGQLREDDSADLTLVAAHQGQYSRTHQYMGPSVAWTGITIGSNGSISFTGGAGPNIAVGDVVSVTDRLSCCGRIDIAVNLDLDGSGEINGSDRINLYLNAAGDLSSIEYSTASGDAGARLDSSTLPTHDETSVPTENRMAATASIAGSSDVALDLEIDSSSYGSAVFHNLDLMADLSSEDVLQQRIYLRLEASSVLTEGASYECYEVDAAGDTTRLTVKTAAGNASDYSSQYGGRCRVTLTTVEVDQGAFTLVEGTFTGELFNFKRDVKLAIDDGVFRWASAPAVQAQ